ncbi:MAG: alpha/beta hydrolase [Methylovulum sp.]|uniref:alpha/beta hydrolase n=1 Tax=Methylovulum sp. TaxID=1916980 RepID=UPI0026354DDD|nr:alpha/beta hydrolase [Methylovulum sp.]MDD2722611.1 alpha/beta hydrolase [Methylovulum sp.]MDD5123791.1 alpha/beta hydrolase [Methylovulum sp.]
MNEVEELETRVRNLLEEEFTKFRDWFFELENDLWDNQIQSDFRVGKFNKLIEKAREEFAQGKRSRVMRKSIVLSCAVLALVVGNLAEARPGGRLSEWLVGRHDGVQVPQPRGKQTMAYGTNNLQQFDFYPTTNGNRRAPLVLFVHGGGWKRGSKDTADGSWKAPHYIGLGYAYASINYRLVPNSTVEDEAADVAAALRYLIDHADQLSFDPGRIVIMGHSAGAHLVALVGTDEQYLKHAGLSFASIAGVLPIDGAAYDVSRQIKEGNDFMHDTYIQVFGEDPARQHALSPTLHAQVPNAPAFLIIHVQRTDGVAQSKELEASLKQAGTPVERQEFPGTWA